MKSIPCHHVKVFASFAIADGVEMLTAKLASKNFSNYKNSIVFY